MDRLLELASATAPVAVLLAALPLGAAGAVAAEARVVTLTQTPCQFLESEGGVDRGFTSRKADDCIATNARTGEWRLAEAAPLVLPPGRYVFRVTNKNVPYELGFWLREADYVLGNPLHRLAKTSISGGGLKTGETKDYEIELTPGEYLYSCPLNPTPNYRLIVEN
jgi:hypothetical protein